MVSYDIDYSICNVCMFVFYMKMTIFEGMIWNFKCFR